VGRLASLALVVRAVSSRAEVRDVSAVGGGVKCAHVAGVRVCFAGNGGGAGGDGKGARGDGTQRSPSAGMSTMSFQDSAQMYNGGAGSLALKLGRQEAIAGISAAQFAASTGGLTMDTALLARVSGTDPSLMGTEEIKQIMRTPDLLSIYQKLQEEDDRRQRR